MDLNLGRLVGVLHSADDVCLEGLAFLNQLFHALRAGLLDIRQSLSVAGLTG